MNLETNKKRAIEFYKMAYEGNPAEGDLVALHTHQI